MIKHGLGTLKLDQTDLQAVAEVLDSNWISPGPKVKEFETAFSSFHSQKYGLMVNSGTDALRIALSALKEKYAWPDGSLVIVPSVTFVATLNIVLQCNLKPVLADVGMYDFNINPYNVERRYDGNKDVKAIIPVHIAGKPCDMEKILKLAKKNDWKVLEDSCETMGVEGIAKGDITCFSFYVAHLLTTGVGGMATTNDQELKDLMWSYANHGRDVPGAFTFSRIGYSARPTEFEAALGLNQLPKLHDFIDQRRKNAFYLYKHLNSHFWNDLYVNYFPESACMFFPVVIKEMLDVKKWDLMNFLAERGIENRELLPLTNQPCYKGIIDKNDRFSVAEWVNERGFYIGCHQDLSKDDLDEIIDAFKEFFNVRLSGTGSQEEAAPSQMRQVLQRSAQIQAEIG